MKRMNLFFAALLATPAAALAHAGHGAFDGLSPAHYLSSPEHVIPIALGVVLLGILAWRRARSK
jgi:hypothetical protein